MNFKVRIVLLGAAAAATAVWLGACAGQPAATCQVLGSNPLNGVPGYWMTYTKVSATGACGDKRGESIGFQKYVVPAAKDVRLSYRFQNLGHQYGNVLRLDPSDPLGTNINGFAKIAQYPGADNFCKVTDFTGAGTDGGSYFEAPAQRFESIPGEVMTLADGGQMVGPDEPELFMKYEWTDLNFLATVNAPGTILTGELKYTENNCTATFKAFGLWPALNPLTGEGCDPALNDPARNGYNPQCDPTIVTLESYEGLTADGKFPDGGQPVVTQFGSGINPTFHTKAKPITCSEFADIDDTGKKPVHHCELQLTLEEISKL